MRKIMSKEEQDKKNKKNQLIIGGILIALMLFSTAGYAFGDGNKDEENKIKYNGITFTKNSGYWYFNIGESQFATVYNPSELEMKSEIVTSLSEYNNKPLYFVGKYNEGKIEILRNIQNNLLRYQDACVEGEECLDNLPMKDCSLDNIIIFKEANEESIYRLNKCVFITSTVENQTKMADEFLFNMLNVK